MTIELPKEKWLQEIYAYAYAYTYAKTLLALKGGEGSGNFGHAGRPGEVGGSAPSGTLYHTSPIENSSSIEKHGIWSTPTQGGKLTNRDRGTLQNQELYGVYAFTSIHDAELFAIDNGWDEYSIYEVNVNDKEILIDPEYDGESVFINTDENLPAKEIIRVEAG